MKKKCIALLLAAFMLISPGASAFAETAEQPATEIYETTESADADTEVLETEISDTETSETEISETEFPETEDTEDILEVNIFDLYDDLSIEGSTEDTEEVLYTVSFDANGGEGTMEPQTFVSGTSANLTANAFERNGYKFTGWALSKKADVTYENKASLDPGSANWDKNNALTLYAKWEAKEYKITYKLNDGKNNKSNHKCFNFIIELGFRCKHLWCLW